MGLMRGRGGLREEILELLKDAVLQAA